VANATLKMVPDLIKNGHIIERKIALIPKMKGLIGCSAVLSLVVTQEEDGVDPDAPPNVLTPDWMVENFISGKRSALEDDAKIKFDKTQANVPAQLNMFGSSEEEGPPAISDATVLQEVCSGPLDLCGALGVRSHVFIKVLDDRTKYEEKPGPSGAFGALGGRGSSGDAAASSSAPAKGSKKQPPPSTTADLPRTSTDNVSDEQKLKWRLGVWSDRKSFVETYAPTQEVYLLKVSSIQPDPEQVDTFVIRYYDSLRQEAELRFRKIDRSRDVWVESLRRIVSQAHADDVIENEEDGDMPEKSKTA